jgi:hypothetical protein
MTVSRELSKYRLDLAGVQEVRWEGSGIKSAEYIFSYRKRIESHELGTGILNIRESYQQLKRVEFVNDRMSYIILRGCWFHIIVLNVHAPIEDKTDDVKESLHMDWNVYSIRRMPSSGMLRRVALVRTDLSEERRSSIIRMTRICELETTLDLTSITASIIPSHQFLSP